MAIAYAGGTNVYANLDGSTVNLLIDDIVTQLVAAGWTEAATQKAWTIWTSNSAPSNNGTVTIDGHVYTFKTSLTGAADEVLIAGTTAGNASNLYDAIVDNSANEGSTYGTGTAAHATCEAVAPTTAALTIQYKTAGTAGNGIAVTEYASSGTLSYATLVYGGSWLDSAITPDGLSMRVYVEYSSSTLAEFHFSPPNDASVINDHSGGNTPHFYVTSAATRTYKIIANRYQAVIFLPGVSQVANTCICWGVPYLPDNLKPIGIVGATNAAPIVVETASAHGRATGDVVFQSNCTGNTAANGSFTITYVDATHYSLNGSTGDGSYDANSGNMAGPSQIARCIWASAAGGNGLDGLFRHSMIPTGGCSQVVYLLVNENHWDASAYAGTGNPSLFLPTYGVTFQNSQAIFAEPLIKFGVSNAAVSEIRGQLWDAVVVNRSYPMDLEPPNFDSRAWIQLTREAAANGSIFFVTGAA